MKFALGTAQFGLRYGIANTDGKTPASEVARIIESARQAGIDTLDTAAAYGDSESILGSIGVGDIKVVTKVPPMKDASDDGREWVENHVRHSLAALNSRRLDAVLLHDASDLLRKQGRGIVNALQGLKAEGLVGKIGYSIYSPEVLGSLIQVMRPDLIQAPFNVFDQRIRASGWLSRLKDIGTEVHTRSVFLQGLLLMERARRPVYFARWEKLWASWQAWLDGSGFKPLQACLGFVGGTPGVDRIVVGVESREQLMEITQTTSEVPVAAFDGFACDDLGLIDPSRWPK